MFSIEIGNISLPKKVILKLVYYHIHCLIQFPRARGNSVKFKSNNSRLHLQTQLEIDFAEVYSCYVRELIHADHGAVIP